MKTIIYEKGSKSINTDKIITMDLIIEDEKGQDVIFNNTEITNIAKIPEDILKICKVAYIICKVEGVTEPIYLIKDNDIEYVISEFVTIQYFLNRPEYTDINYDVNYDDGEIDDIAFFNQYFICKN